MSVIRLMLLAVAVVVSLPAPARALAEPDEAYACWMEMVNDGDTLQRRRFVVCRIAGELTDLFEGPGDVPDVLHAAAGSDADGPCWFWSTTDSGWEVVRTDGQSALLRFDPDGRGGTPALADGWVRPCGGEPDEDPDLISLIWEVVRRHRIPTPEVAAEPDIGLTGLDSYVKGRLPSAIEDGAVSPVTGTAVEVVIEVVAVRVDWADGGDATHLPASLFHRMTGWPDGVLAHAYDTAGSYRIEVGYDWVVRWRAGSSGWKQLVLSPTTTPVAYRVDEIVGRRVP
ncbi:MAG: hypothetical protein ACE5GC_05110 [Acidimicrobiia bacterium]